MKRTARRVGLIFLGVMCLLLATLAGLTWRQVRQARLNQALITAVKANDTNASIRLLKQGADANARDEVLTAVPFWRRLVALLWGSKSKPSTAPTPLMLALRGKIQTIGDSPLSSLPCYDCLVYPPENVHLIWALLEHGANVNVEYPIQVPSLNARGATLHETPLIWALRSDKATTACLLLAHGANVNKEDGSSSSPLVVAVSGCQGQPNVLEDLLAHGANVNQHGQFEVTALFCAVVECNFTATKLLLTHHADVTIQGYRHQTPLAYAKSDADERQREIIRLLKAAGAKR